MLKVSPTTVRVEQLAIAVRIKPYSHSIDSEITTKKVNLNRAGVHLRQCSRLNVAFGAGGGISCRPFHIQSEHSGDGMAVLRGLRSVLDFIYLAAGVLAALSLIAILLLIVVQMLARWTGEVFPGAPDYAGYAMAAASFLAFANALNRGSHIRVSILLNAACPK